MTWRGRIADAPLSPKLSTGTPDDVVPESPDELLAECRAHEGYEEITLEAYTCARLLASEHWSGNPTELAAIGDAELNRCQKKGTSLFRHLTAGTGQYGAQSGTRPASTRRDPAPRHVQAALELVATGAARGVSQGATRFFDPKCQLDLYGKRRAAHPLTILERWSFDRDWYYTKAERFGDDSVGFPERYKLAGNTGSSTEAWVGPIVGIDPWRLMLMESMAPGETHTARYRAAKRLIERRIGGRWAEGLILLVALGAAKFGGFA